MGSFQGESEPGNGRSPLNNSWLEAIMGLLQVSFDLMECSITIISGKNWKSKKHGDFFLLLGLWNSLFLSLLLLLNPLKKQNAKHYSFICIYLIFTFAQIIIQNYAKSFGGSFVPCFKTEQNTPLFANFVLGFSGKVCWLNFGSEDFPLINLPSHQQPCKESSFDVLVWLQQGLLRADALQSTCAGL